MVRYRPGVLCITLNMAPGEYDVGCEDGGGAGLRGVSESSAGYDRDTRRFLVLVASSGILK